jgi:phage terminase large subunit
VVADSAEQKSIREIYNYGIRRIEGAVKGKDSILNGIDIMQRYKYKVTAQSLNLITELRNYKWREDKITGELLNIPIDKYNHAIDAVRYLISAKLNNQPRNKGIKRISIK